MDLCRHVKQLAGQLEDLGTLLPGVHPDLLRSGSCRQDSADVDTRPPGLSHGEDMGAPDLDRSALRDEARATDERRAGTTLGTSSNEPSRAHLLVVLGNRAEAGAGPAPVHPLEEMDSIAQELYRLEEWGKRLGLETEG